ncbi:DUF4361 domain-containing protein [Maribellus sp. YY47]|uniref:BT_3044 domain-containing protein n=1 Tax=Maribellus sp. YY47 TaxID=2929486 RepID=UPI002001319D|nr:DUF4361 domain-containing protein [Maribellus sp. YY47]MCK3686427.1 DUF4361 domain-containing protein [Maribellus sp. YY47]
MKNSIKVIYGVMLGLAFASCDSYDFEQEQYQNEINLLSNSQMIYDRQVADLTKSSDTIYVVAALSGTNNSNQTFNVALVEADSLFKAYNKSNFDIDSSRFARMLPEECFTIPNLEMQIPAGESQVKFPIYVQNLDKLSPDSIYFLNYKIDPSKTSAFNPEKAEVLLRIYKENEFSTTVENVYYNYTSSYIIKLDKNDPETRRPTSSNQVFALGGNSVRMMAGDETFGNYNAAYNQLNAKSIKVVIGDQTSQNPLARTVTVEPYKDLDVVQMTPVDMYDNTFLINIISTPDGRATYYKEFRLHYKYRLSDTSPYREVKAVLRMEYSPRAELL